MPHLRAALLGDPVAHSRAPILHTNIARLVGFAEAEVEYTKRRIGPSGLGDMLDRLEAAGIAGGNLTAPLKLAAFSHLEADSVAQAIGAVNTFVLRDGLRLGFNTDWQGAAGVLKMATSPEHVARPIAILGSGGAARAVVHAAREHGFQDIVVLDRAFGPESMRADANEHADRAIEFSDYGPELESILSRAGVIYNTTPTGFGGFEAAPFDLARMRDVGLEDTVVADAVISTDTPLLAAARARGAATVNGHWWTVFQGPPSFALWAGVDVDLPEASLHALYEAVVSAG